MNNEKKRKYNETKEGAKIRRAAKIVKMVLKAMNKVITL
jgi:hypothetical protein